jgi:hypothetical protein
MISPDLIELLSLVFRLLIFGQCEKGVFEGWASDFEATESFVAQ